MAKKEEFSIAEIQIQEKEVTIIGKTPLIVRNCNLTNNDIIPDDLIETPEIEEKRPMKEFIDSLYWITGKPIEKTEKGFMDAVKAGAKFGIPANQIRYGIIYTCKRYDILTPIADLSALFTINGTGEDNLVEIISDIPQMREDYISCGDNDPVKFKMYRAQFDNWSIKLPITFIEGGKYTFEHLVSVINLAGYACGIGQWTPDRGGSYGRFKVDDTNKSKCA